MLKVAVVGAGHMGAGHIRAYSRKDDVQLVGICDPDRRRGQHLSSVYHSRWYPNHHLLLDKVDAVSVAVPTTLHYAVTSDFLKSGVSVLLEKPIAATVKEAEELVSLSRQKSVLLQIGHIERFNPAVQKLTTSLKEPRYLEIHRLSAFRGRGVEVSVVFDLMIHDLDLVLDIVGQSITKVEAVGLSAFTRFLDIATARLTFANGVVANLTASRISDKSMRKVRVFEPDCYWSLDCEHQELICYRRRPTAFWGEKTKPTLNDLISRTVVPVKPAEPLALEIDAFLDSVRTGKEAAVSGEEGLAALKIASRIERQAASLQTKRSEND